MKYSQEEIETWRTIYRSLTKLYHKYASAEFNKNLKELEKEAGYRNVISKDQRFTMQRTP